MMTADKLDAVKDGKLIGKDGVEVTKKSVNESYWKNITKRGEGLAEQNHPAQNKPAAKKTTIPKGSL